MGENDRPAVPYTRMSCDTNHHLQREGRNDRIAAIAGEQNGVVSLEQLRKAGLTQRAAAHRTEQSTMHRVHRGVYAVGHRSIGGTGALRAALLACGEGSAISHGTAAAFWGLRDQWPVLIDVIARGQEGRKIDGIRCRRCRYPSQGEVVVREGIASTTPMRTLVDLAGMLGTVSLRRAAERAAVKKLLDFRALDAALDAAQGRRGLSALRTIAVEWRTEDGVVPDVRSDFEALVLPRLIARGLPRPICNKTLRIDGHHLIPDFLWEELRVVVETDGAETHSTAVAFQRDRWRDQVLVAAGYRVARITWDQMKYELEDAVARIGRALESGHR